MTGVCTYCDRSLSNDSELDHSQSQECKAGRVAPHRNKRGSFGEICKKNELILNLGKLRECSREHVDITLNAGTRRPNGRERVTGKLSLMCMVGVGKPQEYLG